MRYVAQIESDYTKLVRQFGAIKDFDAFISLWLGERAEKESGKGKAPRVPEALEDARRDQGPAPLCALINASRAAKRSAWQTELVAWLTRSASLPTSRRRRPQTRRAS